MSCLASGRSRQDVADRYLNAIVFLPFIFFKVAAAAAVLHASSGSGATFSFEWREAAAPLLFLPNSDSDSAATFQVASAQLC